MRIAMFEYMGSGACAGLQSIMDESVEKYTESVRISEYIDAEFPPLPREEMVTTQIAALDKSRAEVVEKFTRELAQIDQAKAELLALPAAAP